MAAENGPSRDNWTVFLSICHRPVASATWKPCHQKLIEQYYCHIWHFSLAPGGNLNYCGSNPQFNCCNRTMTERMLRFVSLETDPPEKRSAGTRTGDFQEVYAGYAAAKAA